MGKLSDIKKAADDRAKVAKQKQDAKRAAAVMEQINAERRFKLAIVRGDLLVNWFTQGMKKEKSGYITFINGVPENTLVLGVDYEIQYGAFVFLLGSLDFDPTPEGEKPETLQINVKYDMDAGQ